MNPMALAIICQLEAIGGATRWDNWRADELQAFLNALCEAAGNVELRLAHQRRHPVQSGDAT
jgi:hypothetical protein